jgi:hypothetical protein
MHKQLLKELKKVLMMQLVLDNFILEVNNYFLYKLDPDLVERFKDNLKLSESNYT